MSDNGGGKGPMTTSNPAETATTQEQPDTTSKEAMPPIASASTALARPRLTEEEFRMALEPSSFQEVGKLAGFVAKSGMFKVKSLEDALVRIMTGRALGLPMFASLKGIYSVDGSVGIEAKLKVAMCNQRSDCEDFYCEKRTATECTWYAKRKGRKEQRLTFTIQEAIDAGLVDRGSNEEKKKMNNWNRFPADMLVARASGRLADLVWPEASLGLPSKEDLEDSRAITTTGESVAETQSPPQAQAVRDFAAEAAALKEKIAAAKTPEARKALRPEVAKFLESADEETAAEVKVAYNSAAAGANNAATAGA